MIQQEQLKLMRQSAEDQKALRPFLLEELGLVEEFPDGPEAPSVLRRETDEERQARQTPLQKLQEDNLRLSLEREQRALKGDLPVSEGTKQQEAQEFRLFKEAMNRAGNPIEGDTPESATASTTAGIQSLRQFQQRFAMLKDFERRGELESTAALNFQRLGLTSDLGIRRAGMLSGFPAGPGGIAGGFTGLLEPLEAQRALQLQAKQASAANRAATTNAAIGAGTALAGMAALAVLSTRHAKKQITTATRREEKRALEMVKGLDTKTYRYRWESDDAPKRFGLIAEDAPDEIATPDHRGLDVGRLMGILTAATRALARQAERKGR